MQTENVTTAGTVDEIMNVIKNFGIYVYNEGHGVTQIHDFTPKQLRQIRYRIYLLVKMNKRFGVTDYDECELSMIVRDVIEGECTPWIVDLQ